MNQSEKHGLKLIGGYVVALYLLLRSSIDISVGADNPVLKPIVKHLRDFKTEEQYTRFLDEQRHRVANSPNSKLASILTFPIAPDYNKYKDPTGISTNIYNLESSLYQYISKYGYLYLYTTSNGDIDSTKVREQLIKLEAEKDSLVYRVEQYNKLKSQVDSLKAEVPFFARK